MQVDLSRARERLEVARRDLEGATTLARIQEIVRRAVREMVGADGATFVLREDDQCYYVDEDAIGPLWKGRRFPMQVCISGWAMINKRAAVVPIRSEAPIGAVGSYWSYDHTASADEIRLLQALADASSVAMLRVG
jgi:hypothetical protein